MKKFSSKVVRERHYDCGRYREITLSPTIKWDEPPHVGGNFAQNDEKRKEVSDIKRYDRRSRNRLRRLILTNFGGKDWLLDLTYAKEPISIEAAKKDIQNFFDRLKREYKKEGIDLKYIWTMEVGEFNKRIHFHTIINKGIDSGKLEKIWGNGLVYLDRIKEDLIVERANYLIKPKLLYRRFNCSKNLAKPIVTEPTEPITTEELRQINPELSNAALFEGWYPGYTHVKSHYFQARADSLSVVRVLLKKNETATEI